MKNRGFSIIHIADLIRRIRARIALHRSLGDEAGAQAFEAFLKEFEG